MEIKNCIFVCKICKKLVLNQSQVPNDSTRASKQSMKNLNFILQCNTQESEQLVELIKISNNLKDFRITDFPICNKCMFELDKQINFLKLMLCRMNESLTQPIYKDVEGILLQFLNDQKNSKEISNEELEIVDKYKDVEVPNFEIKKEKREITEILMPGSTMMLSYLFFISTDNLYIMINNSRIGFYKYSKNSVAENNIGLGFLIHLIWTFLIKFNIKTNGFIIQPNGNIIINNKKTIEFRIPTDRNPNFNVFNESLRYIFRASYLIFNSDIVLKHGITVPFIIEVENNQIDRIPFKLTSEEHDEKWSLAMKFLLMNFKIIETLLSKKKL